MDGKAEKYGVQPVVEKTGINCVSSCCRSAILLKSVVTLATNGVRSLMWLLASLGGALSSLNGGFYGWIA